MPVTNYTTENHLHLAFAFNFNVSILHLLYPKFLIKLECGPMPNVMVALPNIGCALCSTPQSSADAHY